jgi:GT2 family glycosyltransferase
MFSDHVTIIIPNYNGAKLITNCLRSVLQTNYPNFNVIIVDDGSTDESVELIKTEFRKESRIQIIQNPKNMGVAYSRNKALQFAQGELIAFLDNDTEVEPNWLIELVKTIQTDQKIGAVQSLIFDIDNRKKIQCAGRLLVPPLYWDISIRQLSNNINICAFGAAMLIRKRVIFEVGLFDPHLDYGTEDVELSHRLWLKGYRVVLCPNSIVYHWSKPMSKRIYMLRSRERLAFSTTRNPLHALIKNYSVSTLAKYLWIALLVNVYRLFYLLIKHRDLLAFKGVVKGLFWNIANLKISLVERKFVQHYVRILSDSNVFQKIGVKGNLFEIYTRYYKK